MARQGFLHTQQTIARCRLVLSVVALIAIFLDPTQPFLSRWFPLSGGPFAIDPFTFGAMIAHLGYSLVAYVLLTYRAASAARVAALTTWVDVCFSGAIGALTEGTSSPFHVFFAFAVVVTGFQAGLRRTLLVTAVSVGLYLSLILVSAPELNFYVMRPVYLAIVGYLVGYLGQHRLNLEDEIRQLAASSQRSVIARDLHDGWAQALAGINLKVESSRELLRRGRVGDALTSLADLETCINREYDDLRDYMRGLAGVAAAPGARHPLVDTRFVVEARFAAPGDMVDEVLQILREGVRNVRNHAQARSAVIHVADAGPRLIIRLDDDGIGFQDDARPPWSISSRAVALGGTVDIVKNGEPGAHLAVSMPWA